MAQRALRTVCAGLVLAWAFAWASTSAQAAVGIVPPNLSGATAGSLPGAVGVSPKGSATYSIPLAVPPGTAGVAPTVGLQYDSQSGMDLLGLGWRVSGQSQITRCGKTRAVDGVTRPVKLDAQDAYCLDGARLLKVSGTDGATAEYRTEIDGISRIKSTGTDASKGPDSWTVEAKDGRILSYGATADALFLAPGTTTRLTWAISRSQDRYGNYVSYQYVDSDATGEFYLSRIRYTGNDNASPALVPYNAINFIYEDRPDDWSGYVMGSKLQRLKRLTNIQVRINTAADGSGGSFKRELRIAYTTSPTSSRSLVSSVTDCAVTGVCLPATAFEYSQRTASQNTFNATGSGNWGGPVVVFQSNTQVFGSEPQQLQSMVLTVDLNGDGKSDLLYGDGTTSWKACLSNGTSFSCSTWPGGPAAKSSEVVVGDFNGDGKSDIADPAGNNSWNLCLSTGSGFDCNTTPPIPTEDTRTATRRRTSTAMGAPTCWSSATRPTAWPAGCARLWVPASAPASPTPAHSTSTTIQRSS